MSPDSGEKGQNIEQLDNEEAMNTLLVLLGSFQFNTSFNLKLMEYDIRVKS
jgi:hypothetical protein